MAMSSWTGLASRRLRPEVMDQPGLDPGRHRSALRALARINFLSRTAGRLWPPLAALAREAAPRTLRVLDVATGGGDVPLRLGRRFARAGLPVVLEGCDRSAVAVEYAAEAARRQGAAVRFFVADALADPLPAGHDVVMCSLFLHHLADDQAIDLLRRMGEAAGRMVLVSDLVRSRAGLLLAHVATRLLTLSDVVHADGPRSVEAAFTPAEARDLADRAGLHGAAVVPSWPCRFLLTWRTPPVRRAAP
jgi:2-polyprenyl-3-methyl-5-hydroxy-6-metoxy-1,4-benzoquinol methylase